MTYSKTYANIYNNITYMKFIKFMKFIFLATTIMSVGIFGFANAATPSAPANFTGNISGTTATLSWTTPADPELNMFELRYSTEQITEGNFTLASRILSVPPPNPGSLQTMTVDGVTSLASYFGIRVRNINAEYSPVSIISVQQGGGGGGVGCNSPFAVTNFLGSAISDSIIGVYWNTPAQGDLNDFDIRVSKDNITEGNFYLASKVLQYPSPLPGQAQSVQISGLEKNTRYYVGIKIRNICAGFSPLVTTSATTLAGGGGGGTPTPPGGGGGGGSSNPIIPVSGARVIINNGAEKTYSTAVTLTLTAPGAAQMKISNLSDVSDASWQPYTDKKSWTLTNGDGMKTVYVRYRNTNNVEAEIVSDDIRLGDEPPAPQPQQPTNTNTTTTQIIYVPVTQPGGQVLGVSTYRAPLDFNTLMVNWGNGKSGNYADLNRDGNVNMEDVRILMANWVNISSNDVYFPNGDATKFIITPKKLTLAEGQEVMLVVDVVPNENKRNYTARLEMYYPTDMLEYKSFTYWTNWIPVVRPEYDVVDEINGKIVKTAGVPEGFDTKRIFAVMKFIAKKTGSGYVSVQDGTYLLDATNTDTFTNPTDKNLTALNTVNTPSGAMYQLASLISLGESGNLSAFIAIFIFFIIVYGIYFFWGRKRKES